MKTSTTYKGETKPFGASGHFNEPRRHQLQGMGIKTGHNLCEFSGSPTGKFGTPTGLIIRTASVEPTFDSSKYEYDTGDQYETRGYDWTGRYIIGNKTLQENLMGQPIILRRDTNTDEEWGLFDGAGYDRSKKKYYIAYKRQDKPTRALTGEIKGKFFLNSRYDDSIKGIKIRGKRLR